MKKTTTKKKKTTKNILLYVETTPTKDIVAFKKAHKQYRFAFLYGKNTMSKDRLKSYKEAFDILIPCNFNSSLSMLEALKPYQKDLLAVTCRSEAKLPQFVKVIPHVPYLRTPTSESLDWSINKIKMRQRFKVYNKKITPLYHIVTDTSKETREKIERKIGFPLIIKPSGLAQSLLVTICYHQEELESELRKTFRKIKALHNQYKGKDKPDEPKVLVEELMEGEMYSIDGHVNSRGKVYYYPPVYITTGRTIGFDDFFGYKQITPTTLSKTSIASLQETTHDGLYALGLRNTTFHAELMKTERGWKIIEIGPRVGGFRDKMYRLAYGIDETANDIFIRIPKKPIIKNRVLGHTASMKFFAKKEGRLTALTGTQKAKKLESFYEISVNKKIGDQARFAKNGGKSVFTITLFNKDRSRLLADIRRLEKMVIIKTKR